MITTYAPDPLATPHAVVVGAGIMGATMAMRLRELHPDWTILVLEAGAGPALESSRGWNNAGTGHAAYCELNYTPLLPDGTVDVAKALLVNQQWHESLEAWQRWTEEGLIDDDFMVRTPHMSFVEGEANVAYLRKRWEALRAYENFSAMEFTTDPAVIAEWAPLLMIGREDSEPLAATRMSEGRDVDFEHLSRALLVGSNAAVAFNTVVEDLVKTSEGWRVVTTNSTHLTPFVFVAAGGGTLPLLQKAGIKEVRGYGGFPIAGKFWKSRVWDLTFHKKADLGHTHHGVKVYGQPPVGAPPMSVPHFDARRVDGERALLFGPFAGFSTKYLKSGSWLDLFRALKLHNLLPMLWVAFTNFDLVRYLVRELFSSRKRKLKALQQFFPQARLEDWEEIVAGQRVQVIKPKGRFKGELQFGTELILEEEGTMAGLLGASPGASTAVHIVEQLIANTNLGVKHDHA